MMALVSILHVQVVQILSLVISIKKLGWRMALVSTLHVQDVLQNLHVTTILQLQLTTAHVTLCHV